MLRSLTRSAVAPVVVLALTSCGRAPQTAGSASAGGSSGQTIVVADAPALRWGEGDYGVVLAHGAAFDAASWEEQAVAIADQGASVIAVEDIDPDAIRDAVEQLQGEGVADVALVGASAGADAILDLASQDPELADQLILLSPNATVEGLGEEPKLFVASKDEPVAHVSTESAESSPGEENAVMILPGSAHAQNIFATDQAGPVLDSMLQRLKRFAAP
ncbi:alpha/beta fold hydrolase [Nocardioides sp. Leaf285]|uniref:alpha/beta fold hydrolase n=1 Tax=Nocardioides sp. Leaf285 TaxID=1736322 RepID=UPI00191073E6|nr:alpha/beta hydrolase [Nocardioides sp. Leaf285]